MAEPLDYDAVLEDCDLLERLCGGNTGNLRKLCGYIRKMVQRIQELELCEEYRRAEERAATCATCKHWTRGPAPLNRSGPCVLLTIEGGDTPDDFGCSLHEPKEPT